MKTNLAININNEEWEKEISEVSALSNNILAAVLDYVKKHEKIDFLTLKKPININVALSNDQEIASLNKKYRGINKPTNVLSFAFLDDDAFYSDLDLFDEIDLGDIIIAFETTKKEAAEKNIAFVSHYCHLLIHGILHLLGFDHQENEEADYMEAFEIEILKTLKINNPYES